MVIVMNVTIKDTIESPQGKFPLLMGQTLIIQQESIAKQILLQLKNTTKTYLENEDVSYKNLKDLIISNIFF